MHNLNRGAFGDITDAAVTGASRVL